MAKIFGIEGGYQVPSLSQAIAPTLDIPVMEFDSIQSALDSYSTQEENDIANAEENFNAIGEFHDKLIGEKFDNEKQRDVFEKARKDVGIGDDAFRISINDLKDNYKMRGIRSKVGQIYDRADVQDVFFEQKRSKDYLDKIYNLKDMNPTLYKKALSKYNKYRNGELSGFDLLPQEFQPIDVTSAIAESLKLIPQIDTSTMETKHGFAYEQIVKERSREAIDSVISRLNSNAAFKNNLEAMFTKADGSYDEEASKAYVDQIASEYAKQYIDIENVKQIESQSPLDKTVTNIMDDISRMGGDANAIMKNKTVLEQAAKGGKMSITEDDTSITVTHLIGKDDTKVEIVIPKTGASGSVQYNMSIKGQTVQLDNSAVNDYLETNPTVKKHSRAWGMDKLSVNDGNKTKAYFKDGYFYTNDVQALWDLGLVPPKTDYEYLKNFGFTSEKQGDNSILFSIPVTSDRAKTSYDVYVPNEKNIEAKLDSSTVISKYPKDGEEYNIAKIFLASPEIQEGYFEDVYMQQDFKEYFQKVEGEAPLKPNGKHDISGVHPSLKPLLETYTKEKLKYLAHHHANASGGFLKEGDADIDGNPNADKQLKDKWVEIDKIMADNPGLGFTELLKKLESTNTYDAVNTKSSALGIYQMTLGNHYEKIKKYIIDNTDKVAQQVEGDSEPEPVSGAVTEPVDDAALDLGTDEPANPFASDFQAEEKKSPSSGVVEPITGAAPLAKPTPSKSTVVITPLIKDKTHINKVVNHNFIKGHTKNISTSDQIMLSKAVENYGEESVNNFLDDYEEMFKEDHTLSLGINLANFLKKGLDNTPLIDDDYKNKRKAELDKYLKEANNADYYERFPNEKTPATTPVAKPAATPKPATAPLAKPTATKSTTNTTQVSLDSYEKTLSPLVQEAIKDVKRGNSVSMGLMGSIDNDYIGNKEDVAQFKEWQKRRNTTLGPVVKQSQDNLGGANLLNISAKTIEDIAKVDSKAAKNPLILANRYLGIDENNPTQQETIKGFLNTAVPGFVNKKSEVSSSKAAWCAAFVNSVLKEGGFDSLDAKGDNYRLLGARNYTKIGTKVDGLDNGAKPGDIVVIRNKRNGQYHVAFYAGKEGDSHLMLGGNQSNKVTVEPINQGRFEISAVRRINNMGDISIEELNKMKSSSGNKGDGSTR